MDNDTTLCMNGELQSGDLVLSLNNSGYSLLVGEVHKIAKPGGGEHDTHNSADDVHVDFTVFDYFDIRREEIERHFKEMYGQAKSFDELPLDDVIMSPDMLVSIKGISRDNLFFILDSAANAEAYCGRILSEQGTPEKAGQYQASAHGAMLEERLYSPLKFFLHNPREEEENGEYGSNDLYDECYKIPNNWALAYTEAIELAIRRDRDWMDQTHGLAEYLPDELRQKIWSLFPDIEVMGDGQIYCSAKMELTAALTPDETAALKDYWSGQLSDGWGEGFEQREIKIKHEELYMVPWGSDKNEFFIDTREEFNWRIGTVPPAIALDSETSGDVFAKFIEASDTLSDMEQGFASNAIYALLVFSREAAAKGLPDWIHTVTAARDMAVSIARYADMEPNEPYGSWISVFNGSIKQGRTAPENLPEGDRRLNESGIRGLAWFACEMADNNGAGIEAHIAKVRGMMKQMADYWGFDESLYGELNAIISDAQSNQPEKAHFEQDVASNEAEAQTAAMLNGVPLINGMDGVPDITYIDTPENRAPISRWVPGTQKHDELEQRLLSRLAQNYADYKSGIMGLGKEAVFNSAAEIIVVQQAFEYFTQEHCFSASEAGFLLNFENPLEYVSDKWSDQLLDVRSTVISIFSEQERTLQEGGYALVAAEHSPSGPKRGTQKSETGYASVMDRIRHDKEEKRRQPNTKDSATRKKSRTDEEL